MLFAFSEELCGLSLVQGREDDNRRENDREGLGGRGMDATFHRLGTFNDRIISGFAVLGPPKN